MSSVIVAGAVIGAVVGGGSSLYGIKKGNRNQIKAFKKQMQYLQMNYNYNKAALDRQERSMYDSAMLELFNLSLNAYQNNAQIEAALAETGTEGRTSEKIKQTIHGQTERQKTTVKEAYTQQVWDVRGKKDALYISTKADVEQSKDVLRSNLVGGLPAFMQVLNSAAQGAAIGAATAGAGSAIGGAVGGAAGGSAGGSLGAGLSTTPITAGALSSTAGGSAGALTASTVGGTSLGTLSAGTSATTVLGGAGTVAGLTSNASTGTASTASSASSGTGFMDRVIANWDSYDKYIKFYNQVANYGNMVQQATQRRRGYYY